MDPTDRQSAQEPRQSIGDPDDGPIPTWTADRVSVRCTAAWAEWLGGLSIHCRVTTTTVLDQAVTRYAEAVGYPAGPPSRLRSIPVGHVTAQTVADFRGYDHGQGR